VAGRRPDQTLIDRDRRARVDGWGAWTRAGNISTERGPAELAGASCALPGIALAAEVEQRASGREPPSTRLRLREFWDCKHHLREAALVMNEGAVFMFWIAWTLLILSLLLYLAI
jgi:hypothetical protein